MAYRDTPAGTTPGFYQTDPQHGAVGGPRLTGRKSGRVAPRDHVMQPAWEDTLQRHDLLPKHDSQVGPNSSFNANQGQLFNPQVVAPRDTRSDVEVARSLGAPTGEITSKSKQVPQLGATPGFMPALTSKQKVEAIRAVGAARAGSSRGGAPFAEIMQDRGAHNGRQANWYMGTNASGQHDSSVQGEAARQIHEAAGRVGISSAGMTRAVAMTSPQMGWKSEGTTNDPTAPQNERMGSAAGTHPNLAVAEDVSRTAKRSLRSGGDVLEDQAARQFTSRDDRQAQLQRSTVADPNRPGGIKITGPGSMMVEHPSSLGGTTHGREKAAMNVVREMTADTVASDPYHVSDAKSQKAANFDASLSLSHENKAVQRIAAQSYTVDRHDAASIGMDAESNEFKRRGVYEAVAMTGRRAALKNRELPPNEQAMEWESHRASKGLGAGNQMFSSGTAKVRPDLTAPTPASPKPGSRTINRDGTRIPDDLTPF